MRLLPAAAAITALGATACGAAPPPTHHTGPPTLSTEQIVAAARHGVVQVYGDQDYDQGKVSETGWILNDHLIVTAAHGVVEMKTIRVHLDGAPTASAHIKSISPCSGDWALLETDAPIPGARPLPLGDSSRLRDGEQLATVGFPSTEAFRYSGPPNSSAGSVSNRLLTNVTGSPGMARLQTTFMHTVPISVGNSGGPLFNPWGQVVGINDRLDASSETQNSNYAIPINTIKAQLPDALRGASKTWGLSVQPARSMQIGDLVRIRYAGEPLASWWGTYSNRWVRENSGVLVTDVQSGSAADDAHLGFGAVIDSIDGKSINSVTGLCDSMASHSSGDKVWVAGYHLLDTSFERSGRRIHVRLEVP
jgi:serine protease Do